MKAFIAKHLSLVWQKPRVSRLNSSTEWAAASVASLQIWTCNDFRERAVFEKVTSQRTIHCGLFFLYILSLSPPFYGVWRLVLQRNYAGTEGSWTHGVQAANDRLRERRASKARLEKQKDRNTRKRHKGDCHVHSSAVPSRCIHEKKEGQSYEALHRLRNDGLFRSVF